MEDSNLAEKPTQTVIACAAEGGRRSNVLAAAIAESRRRGARLILYDVDAASVLAGPMPADQARLYGDPLNSSQLRRLGRPLIADQVEAARQQGVDAFGWLPDKLSAEAMIDYAGKHHAELLVLSKELESPGFVQRLRHLTAERALKAAGNSVEVLLVEGDEQWSAEQDMNARPVNALDAGLSHMVGGARRAAVLMTALGALLLAASLLLAAAVIWLGYPILLIAVAIVTGAIGAVFLISARQRRIS